MGLIEVSSIALTSTVKVHADAMLLRKHDDDYSYGAHWTHSIVAMSIAGPEQAVRAIGAGCSLTSGRSTLMVRHSMGKLKSSYTTQWEHGWNARGQMIAPNCLHLIAFTKPPVSKDGEPLFSLIVPERTDNDSVEKAIYRSLLANHSTPLLPLEAPGQPEWERREAVNWCTQVSREIMRKSEWWEKLIVLSGTREWDPQSTVSDCKWQNSGILSISTKTLDSVVQKLIKTRRIRIPMEPSLAS